MCVIAGRALPCMGVVGTMSGTSAGVVRSEENRCEDEVGWKAGRRGEAP